MKIKVTELVKGKPSAWLGFWNAANARGLSYADAFVAARRIFQTAGAKLTEQAFQAHLVAADALCGDVVR